MLCDLQLFHSYGILSDLIQPSVTILHLFLHLAGLPGPLPPTALAGIPVRVWSISPLPHDPPDGIVKTKLRHPFLMHLGGLVI